MWTKCVNEIIGDLQCGFRLNRSTTDSVWEIQWGSALTIYKPEKKKTYDSFRRGVMYDNTVEFGIPVKLVSLREMCLNESYSSPDR